MQKTFKRRSILPAWWWITLTGLLSIASLSTIIPYLNDMVTIYISSEWNIGRINTISLLCHCATIGLLLLPLFVKSIYLNKPVRIGLIFSVAGYILCGFLWFNQDFYLIYIYSLVENVIWTLCIFSWLYLLWNIGAHWTLKVTLTCSLLISKVIIPLLLYGSIFEHVDFFPHNISLAINDFMAFAATLLIVLIAQPKQPVAADPNQAVDQVPDELSTEKQPDLEPQSLLPDKKREDNMQKTFKRRSILPVWWWITLTGLPVLLLLNLIPEVNELMSIHITLSSGGWSSINILSRILGIATIILLLLPLFNKKIHLNIPARIGLIIYIVGRTIDWLLFYIYYIFELDPERNFYEIVQIASTCTSISDIFSWLLFVWSICAHWTLKVVLTAKLLFTYLILFFGFALLVGLFDCDYEEASVIHALILRINEFMAFAATTLIVLIAQPKQPVAATDEPTQIE